MRTFHLSARVAALSLVLAAVFPSSSTFAQSVSPARLKNTCFAATRSAQPTGDVVADVPSIEIARNGGAGNSTSVFARGSQSRHTIVLIEDGVRVDSKSTSVGANWQAISLGRTDSIKIDRRSTSAIYGSDAIAGVIQIFTKKGQGAFALLISLGHQTINAHTTARRSRYEGLIWAPQ